MADRINFSQPINDSTQIGDVLYFSNVNGFGETTDGPTEIGLITNIGNNFVEVASGAPTGFTAVDIEGGALPPLFMFRKNNQANISTLVGYFAEVDISSSRSGKVELHGIGSEIFVSSK